MKNFRIHPLTFVFLVILILTGFAPVVIPYTLSITLHELAHAIVAKKLGYKLNKVWILPYGACVAFETFSFNPKDEIKIAFAGPVANLFLICISIIFWWIFPSTYTLTYTFVISNFSIMIFNLIPAFPLDGGRIFTGLLKLKIKEKNVYKITSIINLIFSLFFLFLFIFSAFFQINFSFGLISIFLFSGIFEGHFQGNYVPILFQSEKNKKNILQIKNVYVSSSVPLYRLLRETSKYKYTIFYVKFKNKKLKMLTETQLETLCENNSLQTNLDSIYNQ